MGKSVLNAFNYMFKESDWKFKILILVGLNIPVAMLEGIIIKGSESISIFTSSGGLIAILAFMSMFTTAFTFGYCYKIMQNLSNSTGPILPEWEDNFINYLKYCLLFSVAMLILALAMIIPFLLVIPIIPISIILPFLTPALIAIFVKDFNVTSMLAWKKAFTLIKQDIGLYIKVFLIYIGLVMLANLFTWIFMFIARLAVYPAVVLYALVVAYCQLVNAYIIGILGQGSPSNNPLEEIPIDFQ